jgi:hypothetical protein
VERQFVYNMRYDPDDEIKGDLQIIPRGATNLAVRETVNVRRVEFLNATGNEVDMSIIGIDGRAAILREVAKGLQMPVDQIVPSREKLDYANQMKQLQAQAQQQQPQQPQAQPQGQQPAPAKVSMSGGPAGGMNTVSNQQTGAA